MRRKPGVKSAVIEDERGREPGKHKDIRRGTSSCTAPKIYRPYERVKSLKKTQRGRKNISRRMNIERHPKQAKKKEKGGIRQLVGRRITGRAQSRKKN